MVVLIPEDVQVDKLINYCSIDQKLNADMLFYLMALIYIIPSGRKDKVYINGYIPFNAKILQGISRDYRYHLDFLITYGYLESDRSYVAGSKSIGYKFTPKYSGNSLKPIKIASNQLANKIRRGRLEISTVLKYPHLAKWWDWIEIDVEGATKCSLNLFMLDLQNGKSMRESEIKHNSRIATIHSINNKDYLFKQCEYGRLHTNLTYLKKELRNYITCNGEQLTEVDLKNSQPYFFLEMLEKYQNLKSKKEEVKNSRIHISQYQNLVPTTFYYYIIMIVKDSETPIEWDYELFNYLVETGKLYEFIQKYFESELGSNYFYKFVNHESEIRSYVKQELVFRSFYGKKMYGNLELLSTIFPVAYGAIQHYKKNDYTKLAHLLQRVEAKYILNIVTKRVSRIEPDAPMFTIHDSIATTEKYVGLVRAQLEKYLIENLGTAPTLMISKWSD